MKALYFCQGDNGSLLAALRKHLHDHVIYDWHNDHDIPFHEITAAIAWLPPDDFFDQCPNLTHVYALSAGVDRLLSHPRLPEEIGIVRLCDAGMSDQMAEYVLYGVLHAHRQFHEYAIAQRSAHWKRGFPATSAQDIQVGILGAGILGQKVAERLAINRFRVSCWSRTSHKLPSGIDSYEGQHSLDEFLSNSHILVCLLPLTPQTRHILSSNLFLKLPYGSFVINPGRGEHLWKPIYCLP